MPTATELRELEDDELEARLEEYRREMLNLRFQLATGQLDNTTRLNLARRNVARVLTVLHDREIALAEGRDAGPVIFEHPVRPPRRRLETTGEETTDDDITDEFDAEADTGDVAAETEMAGDDGSPTDADEEDE